MGMFWSYRICASTVFRLSNIRERGGDNELHMGFEEGKGAQFWINAYKEYGV
jgi:hypothetical protein